MSYRSELIQCAAVCIAMVTDLDNGSTQIHDDVGSFMDANVIDEVINERRKQEAKWGPQHHSYEKWFTILGEEVGEVANAILEKDIT